MICTRCGKEVTVRTSEMCFPCWEASKELIMRKNGERVFFNTNIHQGYGKIKGLSTNPEAFIGVGYIVEPEDKIGEYDCICVFEMHIHDNEGATAVFSKGAYAYVQH
jgi:hypothetical protein